ncbi:phenylalanine--tRNA ligase, mitochondrial [Palaemon carinicauda]|uniref:phenylalanine--tRNA ligase, mitochondrial n=1 Tax=Palaemon carinicauda TaxID=392227 RepID=UPI0035B5F1D2
MLSNLRRPLLRRLHTLYYRSYSTASNKASEGKITIAGKDYKVDHMTNVSPQILSRIGQNLHLLKYHPLNHMQTMIVKYLYNRYITARGNPLFSLHNQFHPVVTTQANFDSLLIPKDHISRRKSDNYYVNENYLLRAHTSAHQCEMIKMGFDNFLVVGDVYRRDEIDSSHYPVFHQMEAVRLCDVKEVFGIHQDMQEFTLFENGERTDRRQGVHKQEAVDILERDLKGCLEGLAATLFGKDVEMKWVDAYFPFTHPSWELEIKIGDEWIELLGCGIIEQEILVNCSSGHKVGWAFGLGLERWAMKFYEIPDIRVFWSKDSGILSQFHYDDPSTRIKFKRISQYPQCPNDISFWLPTEGYDSADFYDLVRSIGGNIVEQVKLIDSFFHPKKKLTSHCYRIIYRHMERTLSQEEVNTIHKAIENEASKMLNVVIR